MSYKPEFFRMVSYIIFNSKKPAEFTICWLNYLLLKVAYHFFLIKKYFKNTSANHLKPENNQ